MRGVALPLRPFLRRRAAAQQDSRRRRHECGYRSCPHVESSCRSSTRSAAGGGIDSPTSGPRAVIPVRASIVPASPGALGGTVAAAAPQSPDDSLVLTRQHMVQSPLGRVVRQRRGPILDHGRIASPTLALRGVTRRFTPTDSDGAAPPPSRRFATRRGPATSGPDRRSILGAPSPP